MCLRLDQSVQEPSALSSQSCQASDCHCIKMFHRLDQICELQWQSEERQIWLPMAGGSCTGWSNLRYIGRIYDFRRYFNISRPNFGAIMPRALSMCFSKYVLGFRKNRDFAHFYGFQGAFSGISGACGHLKSIYFAWNPNFCVKSPKKREIPILGKTTWEGLWAANKT